MMYEKVAEKMITRTERGLVVAGTRVTLYLILDYVLDQWPSHLIADELGLTQKQIDAALAYIQNHKAVVMDEYAQVLRRAEKLRQYYTEHNRPYSERAQSLSDTPERRRFRELRERNRQRYNI
jgi:uncharacterized protein (DUF433 family)